MLSRNLNIFILVQHIALIFSRKFSPLHIKYYFFICKIIQFAPQRWWDTEVFSNLSSEKQHYATLEFLIPVHELGWLQINFTCYFVLTSICQTNRGY